MRPLVPILLGFAAVVVFQGCKKSDPQVSATKATAHATSLVALTAKDVDEVERGLPEGAKRLAAVYAHGADPRDDLNDTHVWLAKVRRDVTDLSNSKCTFFALADMAGVGIRNDLNTDLMAGQNLGQIFPDILKAAAGEYAETTGAFPNDTAQGKPDKDWVAAAPVSRDDGAVAGIFVAGWSYRLFARHLYETLKQDIYDDAAKNKAEDQIPIFYVAVFDRTGVYSGPQTPDVNEDTMKALDLVTKTAGGPYEAVIDITSRPFGIAAMRTPRLGADTGVAVLRSEI
jgi:hypothetical protein